MYAVVEILIKECNTELNPVYCNSTYIHLIFQNTFYFWNDSLK